MHCQNETFHLLSMDLKGKYFVVIQIYFKIYLPLVERCCFFSVVACVACTLLSVRADV